MNRVHLLPVALFTTSQIFSHLKLTNTVQGQCWARGTEVSQICFLIITEPESSRERPTSCWKGYRKEQRVDKS